RPPARNAVQIRSGTSHRPCAFAATAKPLPRANLTALPEANAELNTRPAMLAILFDESSRCAGALPLAEYACGRMTWDDMRESSWLCKHLKIKRLDGSANGNRRCKAGFRAVPTRPI